MEPSTKNATFKTFFFLGHRNKMQFITKHTTNDGCFLGSS